MKRALLVISGGLAVTVLLVSVGTELVLNLTGWGAMIAQAKGFAALMDTLTRMLVALTGFVYAPTALLVGYFVGLLSYKWKIGSAIIATCPAWIPAAVVLPWGTLISILICSAGVCGAWLSNRVSPSRSNLERLWEDESTK